MLLSKKIVKTAITEYYRRNNNDSDYFFALNAFQKSNFGGVFDFLNIWHCRISKNLKPGFEKSIIQERAHIRKFAGKKIETTKLSKYHTEIVTLFECFRKKLNNSTGASKALHVFSPGFFPMWDADIREGYGCFQNGEGYYNFMVRQQVEIFQLKKWFDGKKLVFIDGQHKSLLKRLDEYNWVIAKK